MQSSVLHPSRKNWGIMSGNAIEYKTEWGGWHLQGAYLHDFCHLLGGSR